MLGVVGFLRVGLAEMLVNPHICRDIRKVTIGVELPSEY